jgi:hypothetical protein
MAKAGAAFQFRVSLFDSAGDIVASPTLSAGDVVVIKSDDSSANITTLPSVTAASSGVLNVNLSAAEMAGSAGENVSVKFVDASGAEWMSMTIDIPLTASDIDTVDGIVDSILADTGTDGVVLANDAITAAKIAANAIGASELAADAVAEIADAVWDEAIAGHAGAGSTGEALSAAGAAGDPWITALPGAYGVGSAGYLLGNVLSAATGGVTVISAVSGSTITVYEYDTWLFTVTDSNLAMTDYENLVFAVKTNYSDADNDAVLLADITTGLIRIGGAAATNANLATVTKDSATAFTVQVEMSEVATKIASNYAANYKWWLKGIDTTDNPDQGFTLATGTFNIAGAGARQIL